MIDQIREIGNDPNLTERVLAESQNLQSKDREEAEANHAGLVRDRNRLDGDVRRLAEKLNGRTDDPQAARDLATALERLREAEQAESESRSQLAGCTTMPIDKAAAKQALKEFDPLWAAMSPNERHRMIELLVERVVYDGAAGTVAVTLRPNGLQTYALECNSQKENR